MNKMFKLGRITDKTMGTQLETWVEISGGTCTNFNSQNKFTDPVSAPEGLRC
jgi:hypothetical protein